MSSEAKDKTENNDITKLKAEYEKLSAEFTQANVEFNRATNAGIVDDKLELALIRKQREMNEKYQELIQAQIKGGQ